jgi:hypothetical protein
MTHDADAFADALNAALRPAPGGNAVRLRHEDGLDLLLYGPGPDHVDGGTLLVPAALLAEGE